MEAKRISHLFLAGEATAVSCTVAQLLNHEGVASLRQHDQGNGFCLEYDNEQITFADIETIISECGASLKHTRWTDFKYRIWAYRDKIVRDTYLGRLARQSMKQSTRDVFASSYSRKPHGCRDPKPTMWRKYF